MTGMNADTAETGIDRTVPGGTGATVSRVFSQIHLNLNLSLSLTLNLNRSTNTDLYLDMHTRRQQIVMISAVSELSDTPPGCI